ncbi:MAG: phage tail tape measure protein [Candidatus Krumholzibacteriota bacterium]|nr:phage tail tape measure protein [Candidatus Krumholzibacteriota bacterium]
MAENIIKLIVSGKDLSADQLKQVNKNLDKVGKNLQKIGKASSIAGLAITGMGALMAREAIGVESGITNALTLTNAQGAAFAKMRSDMERDTRQLSIKLGISGKEITQSFYNVLSTGSEAGTQGFRDLTETALKMAKVVKLDTAEAVEILAGTFNNFKGEVESYNEVADVFFKTSQLALTTVPQLSEAMEKAAPTAVQLEIPLRQVAVVLATMAEKNIKGAEAGTAFRQIMLRLSGTNKEAAKTLDELGVKFADADGNARNVLDVLQDLRLALADLTPEQRNLKLALIAGEEAFSKFGAVLSATDSQMRDWLEIMEEGGSLQKGFDILMDDTKSSLERLKAAQEAVAVSLGRALLPAIKDFAGSAIKAGETAAIWAEENEGLTKTIAAIGLALAGGGGTIFAVGTFIRLLPLMKAGVVALTGPVGLLVIGTIALTTAIIAFNRRTREYTTGLEEAREATEALTTSQLTLLLFENAQQFKATTERAAQLRDALKSVAPKSDRGLLALVNEAADVQVKLEALQREFTELHKLLGTKPQGPQLPVIPSEADITKGTESLAKAWETFGDRIRKAGQEPFVILNDEQKKILEEKIATIDGFAERLDKLATSGGQIPLEIEPILPFLPNDFIGPIEPLQVPLELDDAGVAEMRRQLSTLGTALSASMNTAYRGITTHGSNAADTLRNTFFAFADAVAADFIQKMTAAFLELEAVKQLSSFLGPLGIVAGLGAALLHHGGEIVVGSSGRDSVPALLSRGENVVDSTTNERFKAMLDAFEAGGLGGVHVTLRSSLTTATTHEQIRMARQVGRATQRFNERFIVRGSA